MDAWIPLLVIVLVAGTGTVLVHLLIAQAADLDAIAVSEGLFVRILWHGAWFTLLAVPALDGDGALTEVPTWA